MVEGGGAYSFFNVPNYMLLVLLIVNWMYISEQGWRGIRDRGFLERGREKGEREYRGGGD